MLADGTLRWTVNVNVGTNYSLLFTTRPGLTLGPTAATATITPGGGVVAAAPTPAAVTVGDTLEPNDTPATAQPISTDPVNGSGDSFNLSYLTSSSDVDYYTFPIPAAGSRVTFHLSHLPADYDLVVYGPAGAGQLRPPQAVDAADRRPAARRHRLRDDARHRPARAADPERRHARAGPAGLRRLDAPRYAGRRGHRRLERRARHLHGPGVRLQRRDEQQAVHAARRDDAAAAAADLHAARRSAPRAAATDARDDRDRPGCRATSTRSSSSTTSSSSRIYSNATPTGASVVTKLNSAANLAGFANAGFPAAVVHVDANASGHVGVRGVERLPGRPDQGERRRPRRSRDVLDTRARDLQERRVPRARRRRRRTAVLRASTT